MIYFSKPKGIWKFPLRRKQVAFLRFNRLRPVLLVGILVVCLRYYFPPLRFGPREWNETNIDKRQHFFRCFFINFHQEIKYPLGSEVIPLWKMMKIHTCKTFSCLHEEIQLVGRGFSKQENPLAVSFIDFGCVTYCCLPRTKQKRSLSRQETRLAWGKCTLLPVSQQMLHYHIWKPLWW